MKGILVILDGIGDLPHKLLEGKTPLEAAKTPNLDFFAARGKLGFMYPVKPDFAPESDEAIVSIFGNNVSSSTRGQLEAKGVGIKLTRGDLTLRVNFATTDKKRGIIDRRAGRTLTSEEASILSKAINKIKLPCKFVFEPTIQHRAVLVLKGGFSDNILCNDFTYSQGKVKNATNVISFKPLDDDENTNHTVNVLNEFLEKVQIVLNEHPINKERIKKGLLPANYLLFRGPGIESPKLKLYKKWVSPSYMPIEIGFSLASGMSVFSFEYPKLKNVDAYANLHEGLKKACKFSMKILKKTHKKFDYAYVHLKETDLPGHDNKPLEKKEMIEYIDKTFFKFLKKFVPPKGIEIVVTADHSTPCKLKDHSAEPVPVLFYDNSPLREKRFFEKECRKGKLGRILGDELLEKVGFVK
ncbi:phosphoglycerate mutase [Candidatus Pacearchaeota archaeon]|nr:phosphoglycerate mutase [Candidatus Pacearchaeota archaeon]